MNLIFEIEDVTVWHADLCPTSHVALESLLSPDEIDRADSYGSHHLRRRFVVRRGMLRSLLGTALDREPRQLAFEYGEFQKPRVAGHPLEFSVSSSHDDALFAISTDRPVGVDIERINPELEVAGLIEEHFTIREKTAIVNAESFFQAWTRKEASAKALGLGLALPLSALDTTGPNPELPIYDLKVAAGFAGALAISAAE